MNYKQHKAEIVAIVVAVLIIFAVGVIIGSLSWIPLF